MKHIRKILTVLLVAMLFVSCNADMKDMGILNTIKHSKPNTSFKLRKVSGFIDDGRFLIETEEGIEAYNVNNESRTVLVKGLNASLKFIQGDKIFYTVQTSGTTKSSTNMATINGSFESTSDEKAITLKLSDGTEITALENSFFEGNNYVLKAKGADGFYYFITSPKEGTLADTTFTFASSVKVEDKQSAPIYLGNSYYYVNQNLEKDNFNKIYRYEYDTAESKFVSKEIKLADGSNFTKKPFAVENGYLFADSGAIYSISGEKMTLISNADLKHSIIYVNPNQDYPMITVDGMVYGIANAKAFTFNGSTFAEYEYIADIHIIDLYHDGSKFYAFSDNNGVYVSTDGKTYKYN